ncbi:acylneuraminate cytidylyltransferase family protein [Pedobacter helvus]|uniref:Cytidylyltransferase domain-containing protein n=1 Tax=Pedobacter helvus TaxID=2563444 RepID=A0ABW9JDN1_9SPHI|nr:acylneuraminate cytidylyltransferase family protein [Pedobacter ureilyticus]
MKILYLIPARGGSKGLPRKNIKLLGLKPLINYTIEVARAVANDEDICVSTDDMEIINIAKATGLGVPFLRPSYLSTDKANTYDVIVHALNYYKSIGIEYDMVMLLQPTSPFREEKHLREVIEIYKKNQLADMVVSVKVSKDNPYFNLFEETDEGILKKSKLNLSDRRQDCPIVYAYNGSIYLIKSENLIRQGNLQFENPIKYVMDDIYSIDIDTPLDWLLAETILKEIIRAHEK